MDAEGKVKDEATLLYLEKVVKAFLLIVNKS